MKPNDIVINKKIQDILNDTSRFILIEGSTGVGKSFVAGLKTFFRVFNSPKGQDAYAIVAESQITAEKMFVDDISSFFNIFGDVCEYKAGRKPHIIIDGKYSQKKVYLGGFSTKKDYQKILGLNLNGIHIEEISIANDDFIKEAFTRVSRLSSRPWLLATTNGGLPSQLFYKGFFDRSHIHPEYIHTVPTAKLKMMEGTDKDNRFRYWHWKLEDSPVMDAEQIRELYSLHPVGSFYYNSKILGIPGFLDGMIYNVQSINIIDEFNPKDYKRYSVVIDLGESVSATTMLVGAIKWNEELMQNELHILKEYWHLNDGVSDRQKKSSRDYIDDYVEFIQDAITAFGVHPERILFDATDSFFRDLRDALRRAELGQHTPKRVTKELIADRIHLGQTRLHTGKLRFYSKVDKTIGDFQSAQYDTRKQERTGKVHRKEDFTEAGHNDGLNSVEYLMSTYDSLLK